jgi:hypothetical protein
VDAVIVPAIGVEVELVGVPPTMEVAAGVVLPAATLDAVAGEAVLAAAALAFFAAARRLAALVAEVGVPVPDARAVAETWSVSKRKGAKAMRGRTCSSGLGCRLFALVGTSSVGMG